MRQSRLMRGQRAHKNVAQRVLVLYVRQHGANQRASHAAREEGKVNDCRKPPVLRRNAQCHAFKYNPIAESFNACGAILRQNV